MTEPQISISNETEIPLSFDSEHFAKAVAKETSITKGSIDITFVSEDTIVELNESHLNRDYITDIITFNLGTIEEPIGDIYICTKKAEENAKSFQNSLENELKLLIVHGILHVLDYKDYTEEEKAVMEAEQNRILEILS
jgi:rRNA maturation RNase YbeY